MIRRAVGLLIGGALIVALTRLLPDDVFALTASILYVAAAAIMLLVSLALFLGPARSVLSRVFALGLAIPEGPIFTGVPEAQLRRTLSPLVAAAVCAGVAALGSALR